MRPITGPAFCRLLEVNAGSHHIYAKQGERKILSVAVHGKQDLKPGMATRLAKDANVKW